MFPCGIYEIFKNNWFEVCERLLLKPVLSPGLPFLVTYTSNSNWYLRFRFCIIIYSFVCQSSLQYYYGTVQYCTALIRSSRPVVFRKKGVLTNFTIFHKKTPALKTFFFHDVADLQSLTLSKKRFRHRFLITPFLKSPSGSCFCINTRSIYFPTTTFWLFKNDVTNIFSLSEYFLGFICRMGRILNSAFQTLS